MPADRPFSLVPPLTAPAPSDRFGRPIAVGDIVVVDHPILTFEVVEVRVQVDPRMPPGHIIHGVAHFLQHVPAGQPSQEVVLVTRPGKRPEAVTEN